MASPRPSATDRLIRARLREPINFADLTEHRTLRLASIQHYTARAHFLPWHRVLGKRGAFATISLVDEAAERQRALLEREGVRFDESGRVALARFGWPDAESASSRYTRRSEKSGTSRGRRTHQLKTTESRIWPGGRSSGRSGT